MKKRKLVNSSPMISISSQRERTPKTNKSIRNWIRSTNNLTKIRKNKMIETKIRVIQNQGSQSIAIFTQHLNKSNLRRIQSLS